MIYGKVNFHSILNQNERFFWFKTEWKLNRKKISSHGPIVTRQVQATINLDDKLMPKFIKKQIATSLWMLLQIFFAKLKLI